MQKKLLVLGLLLSSCYFPMKQNDGLIQIYLDSSGGWVQSGRYSWKTTWDRKFGLRADVRLFNNTLGEFQVIKKYCTTFDSIYVGKESFIVSFSQPLPQNSKEIYCGYELSFTQSQEKILVEFYILLI